MLSASSTNLSFSRMTCPPIILLIFNRPEETGRTFAAIRAARPGKLLVVADGPRATRPGEADLCARTRAIIDSVDWPCEVLRNFSDANLGCGPRVSSGLDWAFGQVEEAIILEDDCLPDPSFFPFCAELLDRYRNDARVMMISGNNFQNGKQRTADSYYFSRFPHCWGWATWRRAWNLYDFAMRGWPEKSYSGWLKLHTGGGLLEKNWRASFEGVASGKINTWDYQWTYCVWNHGGVSAVPNMNLVTNIGFGATATHTTSADKAYKVPSWSMKFPLRHPHTVESCAPADLFEQRYLNRISLIDRIYNRLNPLIAPVRPLLRETRLWKSLRALAMKR